MKKILDKFYDIVMIFCKVLLIAESLIVAVVVIGRYIFSKTPTWSEELVLTCMIYMALISASLAIRRGAHIRMTIYDRKLSPAVVNVLDLIADIAVLALAVIMIVVGYNFAASAKGYYASIPWLSKFWLYIPVCIAGVCMLIFEIEKIVEHVSALIKNIKGGEKAVNTDEH